ncbi:MAG: hypothetical protein AB1394_00130 [Bacteroidota bacterium]
MNDQVLIIEADIVKIRKLREILSKEGLNIITVTDRESALSICSKVKIEYVITNLADLGLREIEVVNRK